MPQEDTSGQAIRWFATHVERYCSLIENHSTLPLNEFVWTVSVTLSSLHVGVCWLPKVGPDHPAIEYDLGTVKEEAEGIVTLREAIAAKAGPNDSYHRFYDVYAGDAPATFSLAEDLVDIYWDLKHGLTEFHKGTEHSRLGAVRHWATFFGIHWGRHMAGAMQAIHQILYPLYGEDDE